MDIYTWIAIIIFALIATFLPIAVPLRVLVSVIATVCFYYLRKRYDARKAAKNGEAEMPAADCAELAEKILKALGGKENIVNLDYCATRLRFEVHSYAAVDEGAAKAAGAVNVIRPAKNSCQIVLKGDVQAVYDALRKLL